jgi:HK97 family phage major capsid protein
MDRMKLPGRAEWLVVPDEDINPFKSAPGVLLGFTDSGKPIFHVTGGAPANVDDWIPIEYDSEVVQRVLMESCIERYANRVPMRSKTKSIPRSAGIVVSAGTTYTDDTSTNDEVTITARRFIARFKIDEDDLADASTRVDVIRTKGVDWAISYADTFDNACLAVTGAENGTTVPFTSLYRQLRSTDNDVSYTADDNYLTWDDDKIAISGTPDGTSLYEKLSGMFRLVETGKYWSPADSLVIAHPGWRDALRLCTDAQGRPIFQPGAGFGLPGNGTPDMLFNTPISWSRGAKTSALNSGSPDGNDLIFFVNRRFLRRGDRSGPETLTDDARAQDDTDDYAIKFRTRRAFKCTHPAAAAVVERLTD